MFGSKHQAAYVPGGSSGKIKFMLFGIGFGFIGGYIVGLPSPERSAQKGPKARVEANAEKPSSSQFLYEFFDALPKKRLAPQGGSAPPSRGTGGGAGKDFGKTLDLKTLQHILQKMLDRALAKSDQKPTALPLAKDLAQELAPLLPKPIEQSSGKPLSETLAKSLEKSLERSLAKTLEQTLIKSLAKSPKKPTPQLLAKELALELAQLLPSLLQKQSVPVQQPHQTQQPRQVAAPPPPKSEIPPRQLPSLFSRGAPTQPHIDDGLVSLKPDLPEDPDFGSDFADGGAINDDFYGEPRRFREGSQNDPYKASAAKTQYLVRVGVFDSPLEAKKNGKEIAT